MKKRWVLLRSYWVRESVMNANALTHAIWVERMAKASNIYFARYSALQLQEGAMKEVNYTEIKLETAASAKALCAPRHGDLSILRSEAKNMEEPGSVMHAKAFQAIKLLQGDATKDPRELGDVLHWMANMAGLAYIEEMRMYSGLLLHFMDQKEHSLESVKNMVRMKV